MKTEKMSVRILPEDKEFLARLGGEEGYSAGLKKFLDICRRELKALDKTISDKEKMVKKLDEQIKEKMGIIRSLEEISWSLRTIDSYIERMNIRDKEEFEKIKKEVSKCDPLKELKN